MNRKKLLSASFWLIMAIHLIVFTSVGLFTSGGWRLLILFLAGLAVLGALAGAGRLLHLYSGRRSKK
jgi:hypothetical protein